MRHFLTGLLIAILVLLPTSGYAKPCGNGYIEDSDTCHKGTEGGGDGTDVGIVVGVLVAVVVVPLLITLGVWLSKGSDQPTGTCLSSDGEVKLCPVSDPAPPQQPPSDPCRGPGTRPRECP
jgi:hypothetical protein